MFSRLHAIAGYCVRVRVKLPDSYLQDVPRGTLRSEYRDSVSGTWFRDARSTLRDTLSGAERGVPISSVSEFASLNFVDISQTSFSSYVCDILDPRHHPVQIGVRLGRLLPWLAPVLDLRL